MLKLYVAVQNKLASLKKFFTKKEEGASMVEYAILLGLITAAVIAAVIIMGGKVKAAFEGVNAAWS
jgi:pilus assembly protein Flp/PilA